ncbi:MAG: site-specific DNA-methyltransferase [Armatimonadetes bacterium]|nr:site-specific DNA-methyltransferase [Armatimonadota bacterium]
MALSLSQEPPTTTVRHPLGYPVTVGEFWTARQRQMHSLHYAVSYRASFKPELPEYFIRRYCGPGGIVFDPFSGRGTTLLQANLMGRFGYANDANPLSERIARPKTEPPALAELEVRLNRISVDAPADLSEYPQFEMFYHERTYRELLNLRRYLAENRAKADRFIEMIALSRLHGHSPGFFSVYSFPQISVPRERQRRINAERSQTPDYRPVLPLILRKAKRVLKDFTPDDLARLNRVAEANRFVTHDARNVESLPSESVDLVVTSPPFLNKADYLQDNWLEFWFTEIDLEAIRPRIVQTPDLEEWCRFMGEVIGELYRLLKPGGRSVIEVGEVVYRGQVVNLDEEIAKLGLSRGFDVEEVFIHQQQFTKLANCFRVENNLKGTNTHRMVALRKH